MPCYPLYKIMHMLLLGLVIYDNELKQRKIKMLQKKSIINIIIKWNQSEIGSLTF